jgi:DNA polymerase III epsilon subunit-like protein
MAEEDTRKLLRVFGVTVTNFEDRSAVLLERAKHLRDMADAAALAELLKEAANEVMELQDKWREISDHIVQQQRKLLGELSAIAGSALEEAKRKLEP